MGEVSDFGMKKRAGVRGAEEQEHFLLKEGYTAVAAQAGPVLPRIPGLSLALRRSLVLLSGYVDLALPLSCAAARFR